MICALLIYYIWYISIQELENGIGSPAEEGHAAMDAGFHTLRGPEPSHLDVTIYLVQTQVPGTKFIALWQYELHGDHSVSCLKKTSLIWMSYGWGRSEAVTYVNCGPGRVSASGYSREWEVAGFWIFKLVRPRNHIKQVSWVKGKYPTTWSLILSSIVGKSPTCEYPSFSVPFWAQITNLHVNLVFLTLPACESRWSLR